MKHCFSPARLAVLAWAVMGISAFAQTATDASHRLAEVVVSASLLEQRASDALPATTLITRQDIERSQAVDLPSLLRQQAGIQIGQRGGPGGVASAFVRGAESRHVLVLVDGLPTSSLNFNLAAPEHLSLADVERIEVVRGNVSSIYGSAALGGVVQIFTRRRTAEPWLETRVELGSRHFQSAQLSTGTAKASGLRISGSVEWMDGGRFNAVRQDQLDDPASQIATNPDTDGYRRKAASFRIAHEADGHSLGLTVRESRATVRYDNDYGPADQADVSAQVLRSIGLAASRRIDAQWTLEASLGQSEDRLDASVTAYPYFAHSKTTQGALGAAWRFLPGQALTAGLEARHQTIASDTDYDRNSRDLYSVRAGYQLEGERQQLQLNLRRDLYSQTPGANTWYLGYAFHFTPAWRLRASRSTGFMTPTFNDLFYPGNDYPGCPNCYAGNPHLRPERSSSREVGLQYAMGPHDWRMTAFRNDYTDLIGDDPNNPYGRINVASARNEGLELMYSGRFAQDRIHAGLTLQDPRDRSTGEALVRRAKTLFNLAYFRNLGAWEGGVQVRHEGARLDPRSGMPHQLHAYAVVDLLASRALTRELTLMGRVENLGDRDYQTHYGYYTPGRGLFVGLKWAPRP